MRCPSPVSLALAVGPMLEGGVNPTSAVGRTDPKNAYQRYFTKSDGALA